MKNIKLQINNENAGFRNYKSAMDTPTRFNSAFETMDYDNQTKNMLIDYMESFQSNSAGGYVDDCLTGTCTNIPNEGYADGEYCWSKQGIYHIKKYNAMVYPEFISHVKIMNEYSHYRIALLYLLDILGDFSIISTQNYQENFKEELIEILDNCQTKMNEYAPNSFDWFDDESNEIRMRIADEFAPLIVDVNERAIRNTL